MTDERNVTNNGRSQTGATAEYAAPPAAPKTDEGGMGLGNGLARVATKISLLTELSNGARVSDPKQLRSFSSARIFR
jgi:hypothetical protein